MKVVLGAPRVERGDVVTRDFEAEAYLGSLAIAPLTADEYGVRATINGDGQESSKTVDFKTGGRIEAAVAIATDEKASQMVIDAIAQASGNTTDGSET